MKQICSLHIYIFNDISKDGKDIETAEKVILCPVTVAFLFKYAAKFIQIFLRALSQYMYILKKFFT